MGWCKGTIMSISNLPMIIPSKRAWNYGRIIGQKRPLLPKHVWAIRVRLELANAVRDLALFNLAIDSKLRGCDLVGLKVADVYATGSVKERTSVLQSKTKTPVRFEITEGTRKSVAAWINDPLVSGHDYFLDIMSFVGIFIRGSFLINSHGFRISALLQLPLQLKQQVNADNALYYVCCLCLYTPGLLVLLLTRLLLPQRRYLYRGFCHKDTSPSSYMEQRRKIPPEFEALNKYR